MTKRIVLFAPVLFISVVLTAQKAPSSKLPVTSKTTIALSNADLGEFPYFRTLPNFTPINISDSATDENNLAYFYDGKNYFTVEGQVSYQKLNVVDDTKKLPSEFQIIQEFDKMVSTLGGKKIYTGPLPDDIKKFANDDLVNLSSKHQVAPSAYYGVIEYLIKTPEKEVWLQLVPATIASKFYNLLVVEKKNKLISSNINKENVILADLEKKSRAVVPLSFVPDGDSLLTESKDEIMNIVGVLQAHPGWKLQLEIHNASVGKPAYTQELTDKRALAIKKELAGLGANVTVKGMGDTKPLAPNDTEMARVQNTRVEITKL